MNINYNYLKVFNDLCETLSFSLTAKNLSMAQPAVSRQIKELEGQLGVTLFQRNKKNVSLTLEGIKIKEEIKEPFSMITNSLEDILEKDTLFGDIHFVCLRELGEMVFFPLFVKFQKLHPNVNIVISYMGHSEIEEKLESAKVHMAITLKVLNKETFNFYKLLDQKSFLLTHRDSDDIDDFNNAKFIGYNRNDPLIKSFTEKYKVTNKDIFNFSFIANSHQSLVSYLASHKNQFCVLPELSLPVKNSIERKEIKYVDDRCIETNIFMALAANDYIPKRVKALKEFISDELKKLY